MSRFIVIVALIVVGALVGVGACSEKDNDESSQGSTQSSEDENNNGTTLGSESTPANGNKETPTSKPIAKKPVKKAIQPNAVEIEYTLIGFFGTTNPVGGDRSKEDAEKVAKVVVELFEKGADRIAIFNELTARKLGSTGYGKMTFLNFGVSGQDPKKKILPREKLPLVSEHAFNLEVGEISTVEHDATRNPLGIFVIRRLK